ncbi:hypothetical protein ISF6_0197 [Piscinibacter sakaiensis]|uniref:Uncharacterized protein n=1 Tax=Piscinibacter sakaiensis TaxID=1547922 RepID=A0A0K8P8P6_PISS1|nr:hypothetical protein ISF6_0197 [Piscinibacter sakaiensis]
MPGLQRAGLLVVLPGRRGIAAEQRQRAAQAGHRHRAGCQVAQRVDLQRGLVPAPLRDAQVDHVHAAVQVLRVEPARQQQLALGVVGAAAQRQVVAVGGVHEGLAGRPRDRAAEAALGGRPVVLELVLQRAEQRQRGGVVGGEGERAAQRLAGVVGGQPRRPVAAGGEVQPGAGQADAGRRMLRRLAQRGLEALARLLQRGRPQRLAQEVIAALAQVARAPRGGRLLRRGAGAAQHRHVAAHRQLHPQRGAAALVGVVARQPPAQAARLDADDAVVLRVEAAGRAAEDLDRDHALLQRLRAVVEQRADQVAQQRPVARRAAEGAARLDAGQRQRHPRRGRRLGVGWQFVDLHARRAGGTRVFPGQGEL